MTWPVQHSIREVDGVAHAETIHAFNGLAPDIFPALTARHLENGFWWLVYADDKPVAFAGMVPFEPFPNVGYLKRAYVLADHRGHGLQQRLFGRRERKAREIGWTQLVAECGAGNVRSVANFTRAGFTQCEPEQRWCAANSIYWIKDLTA